MNEFSLSSVGSKDFHHFFTPEKLLALIPHSLYSPKIIFLILHQDKEHSAISDK
jgi:hypothetical protein